MDKTSVSTSELKAHCSRIVHDVSRHRLAVTVTRHGRPVAKLVPLDEARPTLFGFARGSVGIQGDIIAPVDEQWEAAR